MAADPEELYGRLVSGNSAAIRGQADTLADAMKKVNESSTRVEESADHPKWSSSATSGYLARVAGVSQGIEINYFVLGRTRTALTAGADAYDAMVVKAGAVIASWRNRPSGMNPVIEDLLAAAVDIQLAGVEANYNARLKTIAAFAKGERIDEGELDAETRKWLEDGMSKTADWLKEHGGSLGPLIPNLGVSGDPRGLIPQGLGIDPETGFIIQTSYSEQAGQHSTLSMIDPKTGKEVVDVELGGYGTISTPDHAGGVASDGEFTYVTSSGDPSHVFTYRTDKLMRGGSRPVEPTGPPTQLPDGAGAYATIKNGQLYVGTHNKVIGDGGNTYDGGDDDGRLYRYTSDGHGGWIRDADFGGGTGYIHTPPQAQGVIVRDGEYVFSASRGRDQPGRLITQDRQDGEPGNGERGEAYELPYMSEGIIELNGEIIATYESGAFGYGPDDDDTKDPDDLWANPYLTKTPLSALGLSEDFEVEPESLKKAAKELDTAARPLTAAADLAGGITVVAGNFGEVASASTLTEVVNTVLGKSERSLDKGAKAVHRLSSNLVSNAGTYTGTDDAAAGMIRRPARPGVQ